MRALALTLVLALTLGLPLASQGSPPKGDLVRVVKAFALQSSDPRVAGAIRDLESAGALERLIAVIREGDGAAVDAPVGGALDAPAAGAALAPQDSASGVLEGAITAQRAQEIALAHARPRLGKNGEGAIVTNVKEIKGPPRVFRVTVMPGTRLMLLYFMTYAVDVDAATGQVLRMK